MHLSVLGTIVMDKMNILPGEGTADDDPQAVLRDPIGWRAAVFGRLGTAVTKTAFIKQHQLQEMAFLKNQMVKLRREVRALSCVRIGVNETSTTRRGTAVRDGSLPAVKPAALSPQPKSPSQLWDEWMKGINGRLPAKAFNKSQSGDPSIKHVFCLQKPFWLLVEQLIDNGNCTCGEAIKKIDEIHPGSTTQKLRAAKKHKRLGGHHLLCPRGRGVCRPSDVQPSLIKWPLVTLEEENVIDRKFCCCS